MKTILGLLYGGKSAEHEVSLSTARAVIEALDFNRYEVHPIFITLDGQWRKGDILTAPVATIDELQFDGEHKPNDLSAFLAGDVTYDVVLPLLHGTNGEDGTVQGLLEVLNIPYVGNGVLASSAGMDKVVMKQLFEIAGLPQVPYVNFLRADWEKNEAQLVAQCEQALGWPMFVKPANLGSSVGISKATTTEELVTAVNYALQFDRKIVVEQGIVAREIETGVLGYNDPQVSVAGEIIPVTDFYDYDSKYKDGNTVLQIPANIDDDVYANLRDMAIKAFKILDCSGLVRADFFVTANNDIFINEVNTMPGFTPFSMFPLMWQESGLPYTALIDRLIELAIERHTEKQQLQYTQN
ncbi:MAG: D-alanine--D-alanine ligase [Caryophanon sp.]|nr:D-alanine--D-alanine ligase [Caryophanon sp.]